MLEQTSNAYPLVGIVMMQRSATRETSRDDGDDTVTPACFSEI
jgi:hypothetical protein